VSVTSIVSDRAGYKKAVYIIALKNKVSELPPLEKIQDKVTADYKKAQALDSARKAGASFLGTLTNGLAQKKPLPRFAQGPR